MFRVRWYILFFCFNYLFFIDICFSADCDIQSAPDNFEFREPSQNNNKLPGNVGIVPKGFVALKNGPDVVHGIDVSKWQGHTDFAKVRECGGRFSYIRLSAGINPDNELEYRVMWNNARSVGLYVGPYHNLYIIDSDLPYSSLSTDKKEALLAKNIEAAKTQAKVFKERLKEVLSLDPISENTQEKNYGQPYLPIAIDASSRPQIHESSIDMREFGQVYTSAICAWIEEVRKDPMFSQQSIILSTTPYIYKDYELNNSQCELKKIPVWISHHTRDGDREFNEKSNETLETIKALCGNESINSRCIIQQYTSFGGFALFQKEEGLDLDRYYGTDEEIKKLLQQAVQQ